LTISAEVGPVSTDARRNGFYSEAAVEKIERTGTGAATGTTIHQVALRRAAH
jgi:hypothetical protein